MGAEAFNNVSALIIFLGLTITYIPQLYKFYQTKTSQGFSPWFMLLGHTASFLSCLNSLIFYINSWWRCHGFDQCAEGFLGFGLIMSQWIYYWIQFTILVYYESKYDFRRTTYDTFTQDLGADDYDHERHRCHQFWGYFKSAWVNSRWKFMKLSYFISHLFCGLALIATLVVLKHDDWKNNSSAELMGLSDVLDSFISVFFLLHYFPQLYEIYRLKRVASMSLISLGLMCPGTFIWTAFLATQSNVINNPKAGNPSVWVPYLVVGVMQFILLVLGGYYERERKKSLDEQEPINSAQETGYGTNEGFTDV